MEESNRDKVKFIGQIINLPISISIFSLELALAVMRNMQRFLATGLGDVNASAVETATPTAFGSMQVPAPQADAPAPNIDLVHDTFNGLGAFVIPGADKYSSAQGVTADGPGAVDAHVTEVLITILDRSVPSPPKGPSSSASIAGLLNQVAQKISPSANGTFPSFFSRLSFNEKVAVFQFIEGDPSMLPFRRIGGILAFFVAFIFYSEASTFDFATRTLKGRPIGWTASSYEGVSDGRCEFKGYYQNRCQVETHSGL